MEAMVTDSQPLRGRPPNPKQKQWVLRYKEGNHPAQSGTISASSLELAERVGRLWCLKKSSGQMHTVRFIAIEDPILADESILGDEA